jgi:hypothetical protein
VELDLILDAEPELLLAMEQPTEKVEVVSTKKTSVTKAAESLASVLVCDQVNDGDFRVNRELKHGHHGGHPHSGHSHSWKHSKKGSSKKGSKKASHKGKKGWKKHSKGEHRHWDPSSSSSSSSISADTAVEAAVELELPELAMIVVEPAAEEEVEVVVSTKTSSVAKKAAGSWASVLVGSVVQKPQVERTAINHGN